MRKLIHKLPKFRGRQRLLTILDKLMGPTEIKCRHNILIEGYYSSVQDCAFLRPVSENHELESLILNLSPEAIFIDIGANCGFYSALAAAQLSHNGTVVSIEPSFREYRRLLYAVNKNIHSCRWIPFNQASGEQKGIIELSVDKGHTGTNHILINNESKGQYSYINSISDLIEGFIPQDRMVDLIKIDVEGFELSVLKGMQDLLSKKRILALQIEITDSFLKRSGASKGELYKFMESNDYFSVHNSPEWQYNELFVAKHKQ
jgi:FkbM family methyltransferase